VIAAWTLACTSTGGAPPEPRPAGAFARVGTGDSGATGATGDTGAGPVSCRVLREQSDYDLVDYTYVDLPTYTIRTATRQLGQHPAGPDPRPGGVRLVGVDGAELRSVGVLQRRRRSTAHGPEVLLTRRLRGGFGCNVHVRRDRPRTVSPAREEPERAHERGQHLLATPTRTTRRAATWVGVRPPGGRCARGGGHVDVRRRGAAAGATRRLGRRRPRGTGTAPPPGGSTTSAGCPPGRWRRRSLRSATGPATCASTRTTTAGTWWSRRTWAA
jgi:hypothetical protein